MLNHGLTVLPGPHRLGKSGFVRVGCYGPGGRITRNAAIVVTAEWVGTRGPRVDTRPLLHFVFVVT